MREEFEKMAAAGKLERHYIEALVQLTNTGFCMHRSWGFGKIRTVDTVFARFTIDFPNKAGHTMDLAFAAESLKLIPKEHILARKAADLEALLRLTADLRRVRAKVFINITTGTWPSPFWLLYGDSIWRNGQDMGFSGEGSKRRQWINYRDAVTRQMIVARAPLFPLNSIMNQGITYAREASSMGNDLQELKDEFRMFFADGTQVQELYMTPTMMTPKMWDALAEAAKWSRANADVLVDTHWIGGDVDRGEVYGYASWSPRKGIVALRNPNSKSASYVLDLAAALELPAPHDYSLKSPWKEDADRPAIVVPASQRHRFELKPFEVLVLEATPGQR